MAIIYFLDLKLNLSKSETKKQTSLAALRLVKDIAVCRFGIDSNKTAISRTENGKPYFVNYPNLHFNISHSGSAIAVAFSSSPVGIDIEVIRDINLSVAKRFFNKSDYGELCSLESENADIRFLELWTQKEANLKMQGLTLKDISSVLPVNTVTERIGNCVLSVCEKEDSEKEIIILENMENL